MQFMLNLFTIQNLNTYLPACDREVGKYTVLLILMSCVCLQTLKYRQHFGIIYLFWIQTTLWYHLSLLDTDNTLVSFISSGYRQHFVSFISSGYRQHFVSFISSEYRQHFVSLISSGYRHHFVSFISSGYRQHLVSFISSGYRQHFVLFISSGYRQHLVSFISSGYR